jgi:DNA polymerase-3 subunit epsilon
MSSLLARLPMSAAEAGEADAHAYLDALSGALDDGKIVGDEARLLALLAGEAGFGGAQVAALNERFLESMREAAFADDVLTMAELRQLRAAAAALSVPGYFDDLTADTAAPAAAPGGRHAAPDGLASRQRRCGHCRTAGHYRNTCPQLT